MQHFFSRVCIYKALHCLVFFLFFSNLLLRHQCEIQECPEEMWLKSEFYE